MATQRNIMAARTSRSEEGRDERLLDEALAETFSASDAFAVPSIQLYRAGWSEDHRAESVDVPVECDHCHTGIAATVALGFEGADYVYHFCGPHCFRAWSKAAIPHGR